MFQQVLNLFSNNKRLQTLINNAPGPSPWYLRGQVLHPGLKWEDAGNESPLVGKMLLKTNDGKILLVLDLYCYTLKLGENKLLIWYEQLAKNPLESGAVRFHVIDLDKLEPIEDISKTCKTIKKLSYKGGYPIIFEFNNLDAGKHQIDLPAAIKELGELLVLAHTKDNSIINQENLAIYRLLPAENIVEVYPQDWFNTGDFDFGYQWVTRIARDNLTQKICGDGIRLGSFILDPSNRKLEKWL